MTMGAKDLGRGGTLSNHQRGSCGGPTLCIECAKAVVRQSIWIGFDGFTVAFEDMTNAEQAAIMDLGLKVLGAKRN